MNYPDPKWQERRARGFFRYLLIDGILITGGPFAVVLQVLGFFFWRDEGQSFGQYFSAPSTWLRFVVHGVAFGSIMALIYWWRNERLAGSPSGNN